MTAVCPAEQHAWFNIVSQPYLRTALQEKGDALHAMEIGLSLEKLNFQKLRDLHEVADKSNDAQMADFVEDMLAEQWNVDWHRARHVGQLLAHRLTVSAPGYALALSIM